MKFEAKAIYYTRNNILRESYDTENRNNSKNNQLKLAIRWNRINLEMELLKFEKGRKVDAMIG